MKLDQFEAELEKYNIGDKLLVETREMGQPLRPLDFANHRWGEYDGLRIANQLTSGKTIKLVLRTDIENARGKFEIGE
jgi:hypothetical protein